MLNNLDMLERSTQLLVQTAGLVDDAMLLAPTPCGEWNVTELLDHVTGGNRFTLTILDGVTADEALQLAHASFTDQHDPVRAVIESAAAQLDAFTKPGRLAGTFHHAVGDLAGDDVLRLRIHDVCMHIWDLLQVVRPDAPLDGEYVAWAVDELAKPDSLTVQHMAVHVAAPKNETEVLAAFGRRGTEHLDN